MSWYAIESLGDAVDATREFLLPFELVRWLKLAFIVFFLGASGSGASSVGNSVSSSSPAPSGFQGPTFNGAGIPGVVLLLIAVIFLLVLAFAVIGAVMRFVFVDDLRSREVRVLDPFGHWFGKGLRLLGFYVGLFLLFFVPFGLLVGGLFVAGAGPIAFVLAIPFVLLLGLVLAVVSMLTTEFVVPVMILESVNVLPAWRAFWPALTEQVGQFAAYVVVRWVLGIAAGILSAIVIGVVAVPLVLVFVAVAALLLGGGGAVSVVGIAVLVLVGIPLLLLVLVVALFVQVPIQSYFGYYALLVLGDARESLDLIPEFRAEIRDEEAV